MTFSKIPDSMAPNILAWENCCILHITLTALLPAYRGIGYSYTLFS